MTAPGQAPAVDDGRLANRLLWRVLPLCIACLVISTIDRTNIGFAKLGMRADLGFSEAVFGFGSSLFYVGYVLFEVPSTMATHRVGARLWFARIMITWAITTALLTVTRSVASFYSLRFLLGAAEAGLYPSLIFYLTLWFPAEHRAKAMGVLTLGSALGNGLTAILCGALLDLNGRLGLAGWQWNFAVSAILPLLMTVLVLRYLPDGPAKADFLSAAEKQHLNDRLAAAPHPDHHVLRSLLNLRTLGFGLLYGVFLGSLYGVNYWMPTVLKGFGLSGVKNGLLIGIPWAFDAVLLLVVMTRIRSSKAIERAMLILSVLAVAAFSTAAVGGALGLKIGALLVGIPAISLCIACFWTIPVRAYSGREAAANIGAISMIGNLGGVVSLNLMPALAGWMGSPDKALWAPALGMVAVTIWAAALVIARRRAPA